MSSSRPSSYFDASTAFLNRKLQWEFLQSRLEATYLPSDPTTPEWLELIEKPVLLTSIAKLHSELELPGPEASCAPAFPRKDSGIELMDDEERTPSPRNSTTPHTTTGTVFSSTQARAGFPVGPWEHDFDGLGDPVRNYGDNGPQLSPLSPTFGPRKGSVPTGTVARRRSSVPVKYVIPDDLKIAMGMKTSTTPTDVSTHEDFPRFMNRDKSVLKRALWEAAWLEIERNLEDWMPRLRGAVCDDMEKEELWTELVKLLISKKELEDVHGY